MDVEKGEGSSWSRTPSFAKFIMIAQSVAILFFLYWTVQEYNNNFYFQQYLNGMLQGGFGSLLILSAVGVFSMASVVLFVKLHRTHRELNEVLSIEARGETVEEHAKRQNGMLDDATEKHLIDMIRRKSSAEHYGASRDENSANRGQSRADSVQVPPTQIPGSPLPVLKRVDERARDGD